jgi:hypothetical protein
MSKVLLRITIIFLLIFAIRATAGSQVLISLLLGDKLNTGKIEFGLNLGLNRSYLTGLDESTGVNNFVLGFYFDILLKNKLYINTGVQVKSRVGATNIPVYSLDNNDLDSAFAEGYVSRQLNYFYVPVFLKYKFEKNIFIDGGVQVGLFYKGTDLFQNTIENKDDLSYKNDVRTQFKRIDAGVSAGVGYKFKKGLGLNIGARYYYGMMNIYKTGSKTNNSYFYFYADIPIGAKKSKANQDAKNDN